LQNERLEKNPPKYANANNFAIGKLPLQLSGLLTDVTSPLLSPVRPFVYYMMSYSGGAHKSITRAFTFFNQSMEKNIGALNFHSKNTGNYRVYVVRSGNFTPAQRKIVKIRCSIHVKEFNSIFSWLRTKNPIFGKMESVENCPTPISQKMMQVLMKNTLIFNIVFQIMEILHHLIQFFIFSFPI
jgi:hypothetical protein